MEELFNSVDYDVHRGKIKAIWEEYGPKKTEDKYNEIPIHEGKVVELIQNFLAEIYFETRVNKIKLGLPKSVADRFHKELVKKYEDNWFAQPQQGSDITRKYEIPNNLILTLEIYE